MAGNGRFALEEEDVKLGELEDDSADLEYLDDGVSEAVGCPVRALVEQHLDAVEADYFPLIKSGRKKEEGEESAEEADSLEKSVSIGVETAKRGSFVSKAAVESDEEDDIISMEDLIKFSHSKGSENVGSHSADNNNVHRLPSAANALKFATQHFAEFKEKIKVAENYEKQLYKSNNEIEQNNVQNDADVPVSLPTVSWHVPLAGFAGKGGAYSNKQKPKSAENEEESTDGKKRKNVTIKEREKAKRIKGQSSQASWKPEEWMRLKQTYD